MTSRSRDLAQMLGRTARSNPTKAGLVFGTAIDSSEATSIISASNLTTSVFSTLDSLPTTGLSAGQQALVTSTNRLYISNGSGWFNVAVVNLSPQFDSDLNSTFTISDSATAITITNPASDSDNPDAIITYGGTMSDSGQYLVVLTRDSSVWTFTPRSADSVYDNVTLGNIPDSNGGDFTYTFTATDGVSTAQKTVTITYTDLASVAFSNMGSNYGYSMGGREDPGPGPPYYATNMIQKFPFSSDTNATDVGDLTVISRGGQGGRSATHGYYFHSGYGYHSGSFGIEKFAFATDGNTAAVSPISPVHANNFSGYTSSHREPITDNTATNHYIMSIKRFVPNYEYGQTFKFNMASETGTVPLSGLGMTAGEGNGAGAASDTNAYKVAGSPGLPNLSPMGLPGAGSPTLFGSVVFRFPFAAEDAITTVGHAFHANLAGPSAYGSYTFNNATSANSGTHVYMMGGQANAGQPMAGGKDFIEKTSFASDGNSSDVGNLSRNLYNHAGKSSTTAGYSSGGRTMTNYSPFQTTPQVTDIQKFPFATDGNASDVADLAQGTENNAPTYY